MVNQHTLNRWKREGILRPSVTANKKWRCPVCGASREELRFVSDKTPEAIACFICDLPFSIPHTNKAPPFGCIPLPAVSDEWIKAWRLAFKDKPFKKACNAIGQRGFSLLLTTFKSAQEALDFFNADKKEVSP